MSVTERVMKLGQWSLDLTDPGLIDDVEYFDHVVVLPSRVTNPNVLGDAALLAQARYTGVVRSKKITSKDDGPDQLTLSGHGPEGWLGDEDGKGFVYETERSYSGDTFANVLDRSGSAPFGLLRDDAGAQTAIHSGVINSVAGTYTGRHRFADQRTAIRYVVDVFEAEYRVNPDFTLDAGVEADLYQTTPTAVVVRRGEAGFDPNFDGVPLSQFATAVDVQDYTTRVVLVAEGTGETVQTGAADAASVPYLDPFGNTVKKVRVVNEAETSSGNANSRAQLQLNRFSSTRDAVTLSTKDFDVEGVFAVGDTIYVYDVEGGLFDTANEARFRGRVLNPIALRCLGLSWPVTEGMGVYIRRQGATVTYLDITDSVDFETGATKIEVGANPRRLSSQEPQALAGRVFTDPDGNDATIPDVPAHVNTPWTTSVYLDAEGRTRAQVLVEWAQPLNIDASTVTDGSHYQVRWRRQGETAYEYTAVPWGTTQLLLQNLDPGQIYEISVAAFDFAGNTGGFGTDTTITAQADTIPPSTPAAATAVGNPLHVQISHDLGKSTGGTFNLEKDLDHLNVYASTTTGFTPSEANRLGQIPANAGHLTLGITVVQSFELLNATQHFVKVTAVDRAGNESGASAEATVTPGLIDTAHITDAAITTAKIGDAQISTAKIADLAVDTAKIAAAAVTTAKIANLAVDTAQIAAAAVTDAKIASLDAGKITTGLLDAGRIGAHTLTVDKLLVAAGENMAPDPSFERNAILLNDNDGAVTEATDFSLDRVQAEADGGNVRSGDWALRAVNIPTGGSGTDSVSPGFGRWGTAASNGRGIPCGEGEKFYFSVYLGKRGTSPGAAWVRIGWFFYDDAGTIVNSAVTSFINPPTVVDGTVAWAEEEITATAGDGAVQAFPLVQIDRGQITTGAVSLHIEDIVVRRTVGSAVIEDLAVTTAKIAALAVTNAEINDLSADKINAGTLTGRTVRTAAAGADRVELNSSDVLEMRFFEGATLRARLELITATDNLILFADDSHTATLQSFDDIAIISGGPTAATTAAVKITRGNGGAQIDGRVLEVIAETDPQSNVIQVIATNENLATNFQFLKTLRDVDGTLDVEHTLHGNGDLDIDGTQGSPASDYAEMFENATLGVIGDGLVVTLDGDKVRPAAAGDWMLGVVSPAPTILGNAPQKWPGRYLRDAYGAYVVDETGRRVESGDFDSELGLEWVEERTRYTMDETLAATKPCPHDCPPNLDDGPQFCVDCDQRCEICRGSGAFVDVDALHALRPPLRRVAKDVTYTRRQDRREEWTPVGLLGQLVAHDDGTCQPGGFAAAADAGRLTAATDGWRVLQRISDELVKVLVR